MNKLDIFETSAILLLALYGTYKLLESLDEQPHPQIFIIKGAAADELLTDEQLDILEEFAELQADKKIEVS